MYNETDVAFRLISRGKPVTAITMNSTDDTCNFRVYLEFILYRIKNDIRSYRNALNIVQSAEETLFLSSITTKKKAMYNAMASFGSYDTNDWFDSAFSGMTQLSSAAEFILDSNFYRLRNSFDLFNFAYRKEFECLKLFELISHSAGAGTLIQTMADRASEHQRFHILYLDELIADINTGKIRKSITTLQPGMMRSDFVEYIPERHESPARIP